MDVADLNKVLGNIDLHLLDQLLKNRFENSGPLLDVGCGDGRNLHYFLATGFECHIVDPDPSALKMVTMLSGTLGNPIPPEHAHAMLQDVKSDFQSILCINVMQHLQSHENLKSMLAMLFSKLKQGGVLFLKIGFGSSSGIQIERKQFVQWISNTGFDILEPMRTEEIDGLGKWISMMLTRS